MNAFFVEQVQPGEEALLADYSLRLHAIFAHPSGTDDLIRSLTARETALGSATMTNESLLLLHTLLQQDIADISSHIVWHDATRSAFETQAVLPMDAVVLKSVSVQLRDSLVLCSGIGDFQLQRHHLRTLAEHLHLPRRVVKHCTINPGYLDPQCVYGMSEGMVSPFFPRHRTTELTAIALMYGDLTAVSKYTSVAISLSRYESLLVPLALFPTLLRRYMSTTYPHVTLIELS